MKCESMRGMSDRESETNACADLLKTYSIFNFLLVMDKPNFDWRIFGLASIVCVVSFLMCIANIVLYLLDSSRTTSLYYASYFAIASAVGWILYVRGKAMQKRRRDLDDHNTLK